MDLYFAIKNYDLDKVRDILNGGFNLKECESYENVTFISLAVLNGMIHFFEFFI